MAQKTIPDLDAVTTLPDEGLVPVDSGTQTFKITSRNLSKVMGRRKASPQTTNYTHDGLADDVILMDATGGARTVALLDPSLFVERTVTILKTDSSANAVTVTGTINGGNYPLNVRNEGVSLYSDGTTV